MKLKISEKFYSIQGEGKSTGVPAYFIRLTDCNLSCGASQKILNKIRKNELELNVNETWHGDLHLQGEATWTCDSVAVWIKGKEVGFQSVIDDWKTEEIYEDIKNGLIHIIWTGGEPTLSYHQKSIVEFLEYLQNKEDEIDDSQPEMEVFNEIETNGTIYIEDELFNKLSQINCSAKLSNSGMSEKKRIVPIAIKRIMEHHNYQFKFVIFNEDDIKEMFRDYIVPFNIPLNKVTCMPALDNQEEYHEMTNFICEMAKKYKFIAAQRLHLSSWGSVTGV